MRQILGGVLAAVMVGCGGGGAGAPEKGSAGGNGNAGNTPVDSGTTGRTTNRLSGAIVKGPVDGAQVCVFELVGTGKGDLLGCTVSLADGSYSLELGYRGPVLVEASGGAYVDEATGTAGMPLGATLRTAGMVDCGANTLVATPLTTMAVIRAKRGEEFSLSTIDDAMAEVKAAFGLGAEVDLASTLPEVREGSRNAYGAALAGISKMLQGGASLYATTMQRDLQAVSASYRACTAPPPVQPVFSIEVLADIRVEIPLDGPPALVDVALPEVAWRASLPSSGPLNQTACVVTANSAELVRLSCAPTVGITALRLLAGNNGSLQPADVGAGQAGVLFVAGDKVVVSGGPLRLAPAADMYLDGGGRSIQVQGPPGVSASSISTTGLLDIARSGVSPGNSPVPQSDTAWTPMAGAVLTHRNRTSSSTSSGGIFSSGNITLRAATVVLGAAADAGLCTVASDGVPVGASNELLQGTSGGAGVTLSSLGASLPATPQDPSGAVRPNLVEVDPLGSFGASGSVVLANPSSPPSVRPNTNTCGAGFAAVGP